MVNDLFSPGAKVIVNKFDQIHLGAITHHQYQPIIDQRTGEIVKGSIPKFLGYGVLTESQHSLYAQFDQLELQ